MEWRSSRIFIGNVELLTDALADVVPVFGQRAEVIFLFRAGAVVGFLLGESDTAFFEFETFGGDVFAEGVHFEFVWTERTQNGLWSRPSTGSAVRNECVGDIA